MIAVGTALSGRPPHRSVRAELPHTAPTLDADWQTSRLVVRRAVHATWVWTGIRPSSGTGSGPVATAPRSPWSIPFPPPAPQAAARYRCSPASPVLWDCLTPRRRACQTFGISPSLTDPLPWKKRMSPGSLGFREERFQPCLWSSTPWGSCRTCRERSTSLLPSPRQDGVGLRKEMFSEFNTQPGCTSVNASPSRLPG
jgi:hypothetical protein